MNKPSRSLIVCLVLAAAGIGVVLWWLQSPPVIESPAGSRTIAVKPTAVTSAAGGPVIKYPIVASAPEVADLPPNLDGDDAYIESALISLLGREAVLSLLQTKGFVRRVVATLDNLARSHVAVRLWPVNPTMGRFSVDGVEGDRFVSVENAPRYRRVVVFIESVDIAQALALYTRLYPLFQQAYEELGYPGRYFNDRLIEVIDNLLQTPNFSVPLAVTLTEVKGPIRSQRPWVHWEFSDPALNALSAGQKILLRMGPDNARRVKVVLVEVKRQLSIAAQAQ